MTYQHNGAAAAAQCLTYAQVRCRIESVHCVVQNEDGGVVGERSCYLQSLKLPSAEVPPEDFHHRIQSLRQIGQGLLEVGVADGGGEIGICDAVISQRKVVAKRALEDDRPPVNPGDVASAR